MKQNRIKRLLAVLMASGLIVSGLISNPVVVEATGTVEDSVSGEDKELTPEEKQQKEYEETLKKAYELPVQTNELEGWPQAVGTYGDAAIVMDAESGAILYAKNMDKQEYPASITKLLTALLVYEYDAMNLSVEITPECQECLGLGYAHIGSDVGDILTMDQAMHAMLLASSNDIAYAIGETIAKSQGEDYAWFIERMNQRCKELGGVNSNFINTNGVFDESHYSCALDMALIGKELFKYPEFFEVCQTLQYTIPASANSEEHVFQQKHEMLVPGYSAYAEYVVGGKTGYTTEAQNTLVTMADNGEMQLVCVVLYEYPGYVYTDTKALLDYGFDNFERVSLKGERELDSLDGLPDTISATLPAGIKENDLELDIFGDAANVRVTYTYEGHQVASYGAKSNGMNTSSVEVHEANQEEAEDSGLGKIIKIAIIAVVIVFILLMTVILYVKAQRRKRRRERMRRRREARRRAQMNDMIVEHPERRIPSRNHQRNVPRDRRPKNRRYD